MYSDQSTVRSHVWIITVDRINIEGGTRGGVHEGLNTVQYSTVQYSTVQYSTVQYSTVQYSTVQYSTVQYSTVH